MTSQEFIIWLNGFLDAVTQIENHHISKIKDTLNKVSDIPEYTIAPDISNEKLVPYNTICGCSPANGGSGICGCVMPNKLVPGDRKSNIYTSTSENMPFNWQYKETNKTLLHD
jgi:hypothetical protein